LLGDRPKSSKGGLRQSIPSSANQSTTTFEKQAKSIKAPDRVKSVDGKAMAAKQSSQQVQSKQQIKSKARPLSSNKPNHSMQDKRLNASKEEASPLKDSKMLAQRLAVSHSS
jgi:hypothetical protein